MNLVYAAGYGSIRMTVKELIEKLKACPEDEQVVIFVDMELLEIENVADNRDGNGILIVADEG